MKGEEILPSESEPFGSDERIWSEIADEVAARFGTPAYIYRPALIDRRMGDIAEAFPAPFEVSFAVKSNPNPWLLTWLRGKIGGLDVSSGGEASLAMRCGWPARNLTFTGPAKTTREIETAVTSGIGRLVVESVDEALEIDRIAGTHQTRQAVLVRISPTEAEPGFALRMAGRATQFGIEAAELPGAIDMIAGCTNLELCGYHAYTGAQCLDDEAMAGHFRLLWKLFGEAARLAQHRVSELIFGGGMGIPYHEGDTPLDLSKLRPVIQKIIDEVAATPGLKDATLKLEIGRYLVGESGLYLTRVVRTKTSNGRDIVLCDGGINHNLAACGGLGGVAHRHFRMLALPRQFTGEKKTYRIVGPLCTTVDTLAHNAVTAALQAGDLIGVHCAGAYGPSASPINFISFDPPREIAVFEENGGRRMQDVSWLTSPHAQLQ